MTDQQFESTKPLDVELAEIGAAKNASGAYSAVRISIGVALVGAAIATPSLAQSPLAPNADQLAVLEQIDPNAKIIGNRIVVATSVKAACALINEGLGFVVADASIDPRMLTLAGGGGTPLAETDSVDLSALPAEMPEGFDECIWNQLLELGSPEDVKIIVQFDSIGDGTGTLPPIPMFMNGTYSPETLGLAADVPKNKIAQRYIDLNTMLREAEVASLRNFYGPAQAADTRLAELDLARAEEKERISALRASQAQALLADLRALGN